jgi:hypothetical protein
MTTGLTYSQYVNQVATMAVVDPADANFVEILPLMITYSENRIYRDLDFMFTSTALTGYSLTAGNRSLTIPTNLADGSGTFVVSEQINILTDSGLTRNPCLPTTKEYLDAVFGSSAVANRAMPRYFVAFNDTLFLVGPVPDQDYPVEIVGTYRPNSLSANNTTTFISLYLPELMMMASMIYISAFQRNFGRQNDDPSMAVSYESQYQVLLKSASVEEARKKFEASAWSSQSPSSVASPTRG